MKFFVPLVTLVICLTGCKLNSSDQWWRSLTVEEAASDEASYVAAGVLGVDPLSYAEIAKKAELGNEAALGKVFQVTPHGDGAGAFGQSLLLQKLLEPVGDTTFSKVLGEQSYEVIKAHDFLCNPVNRVVVNTTDYPLTHAVICEAGSF